MNPAPPVIKMFIRLPSDLASVVGAGLAGVGGLVSGVWLSWTKTMKDQGLAGYYGVICPVYFSVVGSTPCRVFG
jgi:hypothetical protein